MTEPAGRGVKLGLLAWNQYTDWDGLRDVGMQADRLGYDTLWTWDHLYPIVGSHEGPIFEGWMTLAGWAAHTERIRIGLMVGANTFRNPALVAKMVTALDHISAGRAILGIGAAWFRTEHRAFGLEFGKSPGERLRWLDEAVRIIRSMLHGEQPSGERYYAVSEVRNDPAPVQEHLPIVVGGGGERKTLRIVAKYADANNVGGSPERVQHKDEVLLRHCEEVGRDPAEIERTLNGPVVIIRDSVREAQNVARRIFESNGRGRVSSVMAGPPDLVADELRPYVEIGYRHLVMGFPAPYDSETVERFVKEVKPLLT
jgi:F420-dependent oxidoreductase-like protein